MGNNLYNQKQRNQTKKGNVPAKRVNIVRLQMVKECSVLYKNRVIRSPEDGYELFKQFLGDVDREHFVVACLDTKNQPTALNVCHVGSLNSFIVHPREVMKPAVLSNAAGILIGHNHPSGNPEPSQEDINVTKSLKEVGEIMGIDLLDHIILGEDTFTSLFCIVLVPLLVAISDLYPFICSCYFAFLNSRNPFNAFVIGFPRACFK